SSSSAWKVSRSSDHGVAGAGGAGAARAVRAPTTYSTGTTASETTEMISTVCHQSSFENSWVENGFANTVHIPKKLETAPMIEQTQKTPGWAIRRAAKTAGNLRMMYRMSTKRNTIDTHQTTVIAAWKTR